MENIILALFGVIGLVLFVVSMIIAIYLPRRWMYYSVACAFLAGFFPGILVFRFWQGVAIGSLFVVIFVPGAILTRLYRERAQKWFKSSGNK